MIRGRQFSFLIKVSISIVVFMLISCHGSGRKGIIPEKKFVNVLVDIHLADAMATEKLNRFRTFPFDSALLYGSILKKHGVTKAQFDTTIRYYSIRPDEFQKIYNSVTAQLKYMDEEVALALEDQMAQEQEVIWEDSLTSARPVLGGNKIEINVPLKRPGYYTISSTVSLFTDDDAVNPRMNAYYYSANDTSGNDHENFPETRYTARNGKPKTYSVSKQLLNPDITHIKIFVADYSNPDTLFRRHMIVSNIKVTRKKDEVRGTRGRSKK